MPKFRERLMSGMSHVSAFMCANVVIKIIRLKNVHLSESTTSRRQMAKPKFGQLSFQSLQLADHHYLALRLMGA